MYCENGSVFVETEDQCMSCENFTQGIACPLLHALGLGLVTIDGELLVSNCGFYKEFKRHLKIISHNEKQKKV